jgi:putative ABC transport system permease protein
MRAQVNLITVLVLLAIFIALLGVLITMLLSVMQRGLGYSLTRLLREQGISVIEVPIRSIVILALAITVAGVGASLYPDRRVSKLNILTAIASD